MKIYLDLVLFLNFAFDFILLLTVSIVLKRGANLKRITLGSLIGSITILVLFIPFTTLTLFLMKILLSIIIVTITYGIKDIKYVLTNLFYFYIVSIILGGFLYYLNIELSYKNIGMVFYHKGIGINYIFILIASPLILYIYSKEMKKLKEMNSYHYKVDVYLKNKKVARLNGFLDTGNTLLDPYKKRKVIIVNSNTIENYLNDNNFLLVPFVTVNGGGLLKCIKVDKIYIEGIGIKTDILLGITKDKIKMGGIDCILNYLLLEE